MRCEISTPAFYTNVDDSITRFNDVPYSHRYAEAIYEANNLRWVNGTGNNNFAPEKESSMKEFIMVLSRAMYGTDIHLENALSFGTNDGWLDAFSVSTPEKLNKKIRREQMYQSIFNLSHKMQTIYQKEKDAAKSLLGTYSSKNPSEMFAESFEAYIRDPKSRTKMQKQLPLTYALLDNIAKTNWNK